MVGASEAIAYGALGLFASEASGVTNLTPVGSGAGGGDDDDGPDFPSLPGGGPPWLDLGGIEFPGGGGSGGVPDISLPDAPDVDLDLGGRGGATVPTVRQIVAETVAATEQATDTATETADDARQTVNVYRDLQGWRERVTDVDLGGDGSGGGDPTNVPTAGDGGEFKLQDLAGQGPIPTAVATAGEIGAATGEAGRAVGGAGRAIADTFRTVDRGIDTIGDEAVPEPAEVEAGIPFYEAGPEGAGRITVPAVDRALGGRIGITSEVPEEDRAGPISEWDVFDGGDGTADDSQTASSDRAAEATRDPTRDGADTGGDVPDERGGSARYDYLTSGMSGGGETPDDDERDDDEPNRTRVPTGGGAPRAIQRVT